jgi:hypothetical protein
MANRKIKKAIIFSLKFSMIFVKKEKWNCGKGQNCVELVRVEGKKRKVAMDFKVDDRLKILEARASGFLFT